MLKIKGNKVTGYTLMKLGGCGMWIPISTHPSMLRATEAKERQEKLLVVQKDWDAINFNEEEST